MQLILNKEERSSRFKSSLATNRFRWGSSQGVLTGQAVMCAGNTLLDEFTSVQCVLQDTMNSTGTDCSVTIHLGRRKS